MLVYKMAVILLWAKFSLVSILVCGDISSNPGPVSTQGGTGLSVLYFNACSLVNKMAFLESQLALNGYNIIAVMESHLDATILDAELCVLVVRDEILSTHWNCDAHSELLWVNIWYRKNKSFTFGVFYWLPNNSVEPLVDLSASLDEFNDSAEIVLVGDFNLPEIDWNTISVPHESELNCKLMDILQDHFM